MKRKSIVTIGIVLPIVLGIMGILLLQRNVTMLPQNHAFESVHGAFVSGVIPPILERSYQHAGVITVSAGISASFAGRSAVEDRYATARVLTEEHALPDGDGRVIRTRLVEVDSKHPYHRLEELLLQQDDGSQRLVRQHAMAGDHILVVFEDSTSVDLVERRLSEAGLLLHRETGIPGGYLVRWDEPVSLDTVPRLLEAVAFLRTKELAEPNYVYWHTGEPDDPRYPEQWALNLMNMPQVWAATATTTSVIVAVFDTGTTLWHPDLYGARWINEGEIEGNATDDDGNGYIDDRYGWNFYDNNNDPIDLHGHGTHVHGIIGAVGNNATGVSGVGWNIRTLPIAFMGSTGHGFADDAASGLYYVHDFVSRGVPVRVTNHSWGGGAFSSALSNAFARTSDKILHVAAAGNSFGGSNNDLEPFYPASFQIPNMISVANITSEDALNRDSHYGGNSVHLAAPGTSILSTVFSGDYGWKSGTSMAAPQVSGIVALLMDAFPERSSQAIRDAILSGTQPVSALHGVVATGGRLDAVGAFMEMGPHLDHEPHPNVGEALSFYEIAVHVRPGKTLLAEGGVQLFWDTSPDFSSVTTNTMVHQGDGWFSSQIPGRPLGNRVYYWIEVEGGDGRTASHPSEAPAEVHAFDITFPVSFHIQGSPAAYGVVGPGYGSHAIPWGTKAVFEAPAHTDPALGLRWRNNGWQGAGSIPPSGTTNRFSVTIRETSYLAWRWRQQYALDMSSIPAGLVDTKTLWWDRDHFGETDYAPVELLYDGIPHRFVGWWLDGERIPSSGTRAANPAAGIRMDQARTAVAHYVPKSLDSDGDGLPDWWQLYYFGHLNFGADDDVDGDGFTNAQEYADRSDPTDPDSFPEGPDIQVVELPPIIGEPGPWMVQAVVTDRVDVAVVLLHWREAGESVWQVLRMDASASHESLYEGSIPGHQEPGAAFEYEVFAEDVAWNASTSHVYQFSAEYPVLAFGSLSHDLVLLAGEEHVIRIGVTNMGTVAWHWQPSYGYAAPVTDPPPVGWTSGGANNQWHVSDREYASAPYAWFCGDPNGGTYHHSMDASLYTPLIRLGAQSVLRFMHWPEMEHDGRSGYEQYYWDGAVVELSIDGGASFFSVEPVGGYPYRITPNPASPFEGHRPCFGGATGGWHEAEFDLSAYEGNVVQVRFRFGTDRWVEYRGWFVDDITFTWDPDWLVAVLDGGFVEPGESTWLEWRVETTGLTPGSYQLDWHVLGNAPLQPKLHGTISLELRPPRAATIRLQQVDDDSAGREFVLRWHSETGKVYSLMSGTDLGRDEWQGVPGYTNLSGGGEMSYTGRVDLVPRRFYRVLEADQ